MKDNSRLLEHLVLRALEEDLGPGDITTSAMVRDMTRGKASLLAREQLVLAGMPIFMKVFTLIRKDMEFEVFFQEGDIIPPGKRMGIVSGPMETILNCERTALNFLQRMCGIATLTRKFVEKAKSGNAIILDTRKTTPGLRELEKYAIRVGGGRNHRFGLFDGILIKDNHIKVAGSITRAVKLAQQNAPHTLRIEVEVEDLHGLREAIDSGADTVLLDNMSIEDIREAVQIAQGKARIEASGGMNLDRIEEVARTGVDFISVGALTHSAKAADISLEVVS